MSRARLVFLAITALLLLTFTLFITHLLLLKYGADYSSRPVGIAMDAAHGSAETAKAFIPGPEQGKAMTEWLELAADSLKDPFDHNEQDNQ